MSNLLDKASIVLTPTAYDNSKVLCVKPSDGSGDFDFSRNSAATRVNAQGLVENVQTLSSNLVQNGDFSEQGSQLITNGDFATDSNWTLISGVTYNVGGYLDFDGSQGTGSVTNTPNTTFTLNKTYKVVYEIKNYVSGTIKFRFQGGVNTIGQQQSGDGVKTEYIVCSDSSNNNFNFFGSSSFIGSIDNVSVKEVGQNWSLTGTAEISNGAASFPNNSASYLIQSSIIDLSVKQYKLQYEIVSTNGFNCRIAGGNSAFGTFNLDSLTVGVKTAYLTSNGTKGNLQINNNAFIGSVTNISIIEITDDTNLPRINYEGFSYQDALGSELVTNGDFSNGATGWELIGAANVANGVGNFVGSGDKILQRPNLTQGKLYKITFDILNYTSGTSRVYLGSTGDASFTATGNGTYSAILEAESSTDVVQWRSSGTTFIGSIDNCSVKEYLGQEVVPDSGCGSWLFEPQSTNLITYSEDFSQWQRVNIATEVSTTLSPDGISFMTKATFSASASNSYIRQNKTMAVGSVTSSIFVKKGDLDAFALIRIGSIDNPVSVWFNLDNGTVANSTGSPTNTSIVNYGNGVYRISATTTSATDLTLTSIIQSSDTSTGNPTENATQFYWGGQIEILPYATSYIPTDGTSVTRNQDDCTNGGSAASINSTSGVLYADISALANENSQRVLSISDGTHNNCVKLGILNSATAYKIFANIRLAGVNQAFLAADFGAVAPTFKKCAIKYKENDFALWIDGVEVATDTSGNTFSENTLNSLQFDRGNGIQDFYGKTKCLAVFPFLTDTELQELTTI